MLRRNPNYHGPRPQHLDAVVYRAAHRVEDAAAGVASGSADYVEERGAPLAADSPIARRFGHGSAAQRRYVLTPLAGTDELVFNPHGRPGPERRGPARDQPCARPADARRGDRRPRHRSIPAAGDARIDRLDSSTLSTVARCARHGR